MVAAVVGARGRRAVGAGEAGRAVARAVVAVAVLLAVERARQQRAVVARVLGVAHAGVVLADALVVPPDGSPFRYDVLTRNNAGQATVTRRMVIDHFDAAAMTTQYERLYGEVLHA